MKNRIWLSLGLVLVVGFMLNACGSSSGNNSSSTVAAVTPYGTCANGVTGTGVGYPYTTGYGVPTTTAYGVTGYGYGGGYGYGYGGGYGGYGSQAWNGSYVNGGLGYGGYNNGYNNGIYGNAGCTGTTGYGVAGYGTAGYVGAGYVGGALCSSQQICTSMGQPGMVHYANGCYPSCGPCMALVNGACLPGM